MTATASLSRRRQMIGALLLVGALALFWYHRRPPLAVEATEVKRADMLVEITTNGKVEPIDDIEVRARLEARVVEIVEPGKLVAAGDVVVRLDGGVAAEALATAESESRTAQDRLRAARDAAALLKDHLVVDERLQREGALTRERLAESRAEARSAQAKVAFLEHDVPLRTEALARHIQELTTERDAATVTAAVGGTVYRIQAKKGELVHLGDPLLWIADLEQLRVRINVDQVDLGRVQTAQRARITSNAFPARIWEGHITEVTPHVIVRENRSVSEGLVQIDPPTAGLVPGMTVDVEIVVSDNQDVLQVAADAVVGDQRQPFVYRIDGHRIRRTPIRIGRTTTTAVEILEGLNAGDRVVLSPAPDLVDDARVEGPG